MQARLLICNEHVAPRHGQSQQQWYKMVEVNSAYKH